MATTTVRTQLWDASGVKGIMNSRAMIGANMVGKSVRVYIANDGTQIYAKNKLGENVQSKREPGTALEKKIFNLKANSGVAISAAYTQTILRSALAAERAGKLQEASDLYNDYLNKCQISFALMLPNKWAGVLGAGVEIAATIVAIKTDNGTLLTIDPATIRVIEPEVAAKTVFDFDAILGGADATPDDTDEDEDADDTDEDEEDDLDEETPEQKAAREKAEKKAAKAAKLAAATTKAQPVEA